MSEPNGQHQGRPDSEIPDPLTDFPTAGVIYGIEVTTNNATSHDICLDARNNDSFNIKYAYVW